MRVIKSGLGFCVLMAVCVQAATVDFTDQTQFPVGSDLIDHADWDLGMNVKSYGGGTITEKGVLLGSKDPAAGSWDGFRYAPDAANVAFIGDSISVSVEFSFVQDTPGGWTEVMQVGVRDSGRGWKGATLEGCLSRNGNKGEYSIGIDKDDESESVAAADLGIAGEGDRSDVLRLSVTLTRAEGNTWDMQLTLKNTQTALSVTYEKSGLTFQDNKNPDLLYGAFLTGQAESQVGVSKRVVSKFEVTSKAAKPLTLG